MKTNIFYQANLVKNLEAHETFVAKIGTVIRNTGKSNIISKDIIENLYDQLQEDLKNDKT